MKKLFWIICSFCFMFDANAASISQANEQKNYLKALEEQIIIAERHAAVLLQRLQANPKKSDGFQQAMKMIEVKKSLFKNFSNSQSLESAEVRSMLLDVMKKETITEKDLTALQKKVNDTLKRTVSVVLD